MTGAAAVGRTVLAFAGEDFSARIEAEARIENDRSGTPMAPAVAAAAVRDLLHGETGRAVTALEEVRLVHPRDPRVLNDLAAAYLARGLDENQPLDLLTGLGYAQEAVNLRADHPEPRFNLALALDSLQLPQAAEAWRAYLDLDDEDSSWTRRARRRAQVLARPSPYQVWELRRSELFEASVTGDEILVREMVQTFPKEVLEEAERWLFFDLPPAIAQGRTEDAENILSAIGLVGEEIGPSSGGQLLQAAIAQLETKGPTVAALGRGYRDLGEALAAVERFDAGGSLDPAARASRLLTSLGSPYVHRAHYLLAVSWYQQNQYTESVELLRSVLSSAREVHDLETEGQCLELLGQIDSVQNRFGSAMENKEAARKLYRRVSWLGKVAAVEGSVAEILDLVGDEEGAWRHRLRALRDLGQLSRGRLRFRVWTQATDAAHARLPAAAPYFAEALIETARETDHPLLWVIALKQRGVVLAATGDPRGAQSDLEEAERWLVNVPDQSLSDTLRAGILAARAGLLVESAPMAAISFLDRATDLYQITSYETGMPEVLRLRGRAFQGLGDAGRAEADLVGAIRGVERQAASLGDAVDLAAFEEASRPLYDGMIDLLLERGDPERALDYMERSRWLSNAGLEEGTAGMTDDIALLPPDRAVLAYRVLDERVAIWGLRRSGVVTAEVPVSGSELVRLIGLLQQGVQLGERSHAIADHLYELLIRPIASALDGASELVVVADSSVIRVPFAMLRDASTGRYLADLARVTASPSVAEAVGSLLRGRLHSFDSGTSVLAVAQPHSRFPAGLSPLPHAETEIQEIARWFPRATLLVGEEAVPSRFLDAAGRHEVVHFAGHVISNERQPFHSSLVLSPEGREEGLLFAHRLLGQDLSNLRLAVLSGCSSAVGQSGATDLAASFLAAGVPVVVASLWDVGDRSTAEFFARFYQRLGAGLDPASAFHETQLELMGSSDAALARPAVWAAFQMHHRSPRREEILDHDD